MNPFPRPPKPARIARLLSVTLRLSILPKHQDNNAKTNQLLFFHLAAQVSGRQNLGPIRHGAPSPSPLVFRSACVIGGGKRASSPKPRAQWACASSGGRKRANLSIHSSPPSLFLSLSLLLCISRNVFVLSLSLLCEINFVQQSCAVVVAPLSKAGFNPQQKALLNALRRRWSSNLVSIVRPKLTLNYFRPTAG